MDSAGYEKFEGVTALQAEFERSRCWTLRHLKDLARNKKQLFNLGKMEIFVITFPAAELDPIVEVVLPRENSTLAKQYTEEDCLNIVRNGMSLCLESVHISV
jgi:hypothetical protein